jgi:hypothetical protein
LFSLDLSSALFYPFCFRFLFQAQNFVNYIVGDAAPFQNVNPRNDALILYLALG